MATIVQFFGGGDDSYTTDTADDYILAFLEGQDSLKVKLGNVQALMGEGDDLITIVGGTSTVYGESGSDRFQLFASTTVDGGGDDDVFNVRGGQAITAFGGTGADAFKFTAASSNVSLHGGDGDDNFSGYRKGISGSLYGDAGNDSFVDFGAFSGRVLTLYGGTGNDLYRADATSPATFVEYAGEGTDTVQVGRGHDYTLPAEIENLTVVTFSGSSNSAAATLTGNASDNLIKAHNNVETIYGLDGNDKIYAKDGDDTVNGGNGNDFIDGGAGNDLLKGGAGDDTINGRNGDDTMAGGAGNDVYYVNSGLDVIAENSGGGTDTVHTPLLSYLLPTEVENAIGMGSAGITLTGNALDNQLRGNGGPSTLYGYDGADKLVGGGTGDYLNGGNDNDWLDGRSGDDTMVGGAGNDAYYVDSSSDTIVESAAEGTDVVYSRSNSYALPAEVENIVNLRGGYVYGNALDNQITGSKYSEYMYGGAGDDTMTGGASIDVLDGEDGRDTIDGGAAMDYITGGDDGDILIGGGGGDSFRYDVIGDSDRGLFSVDVIQDFEVNSDVIDLSAIDTDAGVGGDQDFTWVGTAPNGTADQVWLVDLGSGHYNLFADVNGDDSADFQISIYANGTMTSADVIL